MVADGEHDLEHSHEAGGSHWIALGAYGKKSGKAHTAPVYIYVDGNKRFYSKEHVASLAIQYQGYLAEMAGSTPGLHGGFEAFEVLDAVVPQWEKDKPELDKRIELAMEIYRNLIRESRDEITPITSTQTQ